MKVIGDYVYIGSEASRHGLQIFDMKKLLTLSPSSPKTFSTTSDLTAHYSGFGNSHNIVAHPETNMIYAVGSGASGCRGGLFMLNVSNPARPTSPGCLSAGGYVHDAQCVIYRGPDTRYTGREICFNFNEDTLDIVDVTSKSRPTTLSSTAYNGASYTHQGWLADEGMRFLLLDDELDEQTRTGPAANQRTTTYIVDVSNLTKPVFTGTYQSPAKAIDHNQYVKDGLSYQANYGSGLRIIDVRSLSTDPTGKGIKEVGFFDCYPEDDSVGGIAEFTGTWSVYPYFKSGYVLLNSIERGVFSLRYTGN
jgi:choice-of-anchor B domain-containing protein